MVTMTSDPVSDRLRAPSVVVTTASRGERASSVVGFHSQCGIAPVQYAVWLPARSHTYDVSRSATHIAVHVLDDPAVMDAEIPSADGDLAADWLDRRAWRPGPGGVPLLATCPSHLVLRLVSSRVEPGGFACLIGELVPPEPWLVSPWAATAAIGRTAEQLPSAIPNDLAARLDAMDADTRQHFINAAIGAGHAITLPSFRPPT